MSIPQEQGALSSISFLVSLPVLYTLISMPSKITFGDRIHIQRLLFSELAISYRELIDMTSTTIKHSKGSIVFSRMRNADELLDIVSHLVRENRILPNQLKGELERKEKTISNYMNKVCITVVLAIFVASVLVREFPEEEFLVIVAVGIVSLSLVITCFVVAHYKISRKP